MAGAVTGIEEGVFSALSHGERRKILRIVGASKQGISYSEILSASALSTGRLNYHLKEMGGFIEKSDRVYRLSPLGKKLLTALMYISGESILDAPLSLEAVKSRREDVAKIILTLTAASIVIFMSVAIAVDVLLLRSHGLEMLPIIAIRLVLLLVFLYPVLDWRGKIVQRVALLLEYVEDTVFLNKRIKSVG